MAEMIAYMENDAKLNKEILFKVDEISMEISRKDKLYYDVVNATRNNNDYYKAKMEWEQFRNRVDMFTSKFRPIQITNAHAIIPNRGVINGFFNRCYYLCNTVWFFQKEKEINFMVRSGVCTSPQYLNNNLSCYNPKKG